MSRAPARIRAARSFAKRLDDIAERLPNLFVADGDEPPIVEFGKTIACTMLIWASVADEAEDAAFGLDDSPTSENPTQISGIFGRPFQPGERAEQCRQIHHRWDASSGRSLAPDHPARAANRRILRDLGRLAPFADPSPEQSSIRERLLIDRDNAPPTRSRNPSDDTI